MLYKGAFGLFRVLIGLSLLGSVLWQVTDRIANNLFRPFEYFAYFSIDSAIFAGFVLLLGGLSLLQGKDETARMHTFRLIATVSMIIVGVVYHALLGDAAVDPRDIGYNWPVLPNLVIHTWAPIAIVIDYLISIKGHKPGVKTAWWVVVYPLAWLGFSLVRGSLDGWWPYWFINPGSEGGVVGMITYIFIIAAAFIALGFVMLGARLAFMKLLLPDRNSN
jgi:hypothetical protein